MNNIPLTQAETNQRAQFVSLPWQDFVYPRQTIVRETLSFRLRLQDDTTTFRGPASDEDLLIRDNLQNREPEPEDAMLVASGALSKLIAQAKQEPPSDDWERVLDEL